MQQTENTGESLELTTNYTDTEWDIVAGDLHLSVQETLYHLREVLHELEDNPADIPDSYVYLALGACSDTIAKLKKYLEGANAKH